MIWGLVALMALSVAIALLWPLGSGPKRKEGRDAKALAIYEDQLAELDRDKDRGLITETESRAAQVEIKRRMLSVSGHDDLPETASGKSAILIAALFVPLAAFGLYSQIGAPEVPAVPFAERGAEQADAAQLQNLMAELRSRLQSDPDGGETRGWMLLASTLMSQDRPSEAAAIFGQMAERPDATSSTYSQYAEALITAERGTVTPLAGRAIARASELDPFNPAATYYRAIELDQAGETAQARVLLLDRIEQEGQPAQWMPTFLNAANEMGERLGVAAVDLPAFSTTKGPSQDDVEAASEMSEEDRQAFIRSMVDGLEQRLQDEPENLDGWLQLARSLIVLGEDDRALEALKNAESLVVQLPADDPRRGIVTDGLARLQSGD